MSLEVRQEVGEFNCPGIKTTTHKTKKGMKNL